MLVSPVQKHANMGGVFGIILEQVKPSNGLKDLKKYMAFKAPSACLLIYSYTQQLIFFIHNTGLAYTLLCFLTLY